MGGERERERESLLGTIPHHRVEDLLVSSLMRDLRLSKNNKPLNSLPLSPPPFSPPALPALSQPRSAERQASRGRSQHPKEQHARSDGLPTLGARRHRRGGARLSVAVGVPALEGHSGARGEGLKAASAL